MTTTVRGNVRRVGAVIAIAAALCARSAAAQTAKDVKGATPLVAVQNEAPAKLIADPPIPEQLALGHTVKLELADATHRPISGATQVVEFTVPPENSRSHDHPKQ